MMWSNVALSRRHSSGCTSNNSICSVFLFTEYTKFVDKMSRLYDTIEPSVVNDEMLMSAAEEQGASEEKGTISKFEGVGFTEVKTLRLDYKSKCYKIMSHEELKYHEYSLLPKERICMVFLCMC